MNKKDRIVNKYSKKLKVIATNVNLTSEEKITMLGALKSDLTNQLGNFTKKYDKWVEMEKKADDKSLSFGEVLVKQLIAVVPLLVGAPLLLAPNALVQVAGAGLAAFSVIAALKPIINFKSPEQHTSINQDIANKFVKKYGLIKEGLKESIDSLEYIKGEIDHQISLEQNKSVCLSR